MTKTMCVWICALGLSSCVEAGSEPSTEAQERNEPSVAEERVDLTNVDLASAPARGPVTAPVTIATFCDYECRYCRRIKPRLEELQRKYDGQVRVVFKQLPLPMHENARLAAKAAMAAQDQGRFWELHDAMFRAEPPLDREKIGRLALDAGLDLARFDSALESEALDRRLDRELVEAARRGARGTPTSFVNGKRIMGAQPIETFEQAIDEALGVR